MGGENYALDERVDYRGGSSPHGRGKRPAEGTDRELDAAHPRMGGENVRQFYFGSHA